MLQKFVRGSIKERTARHFLFADNFHESPFQEGREHGRYVDPPQVLDLSPGHGLLVSKDGQGLQRRTARLADLPLEFQTGVPTTAEAVDPYRELGQRMAQAWEGMVKKTPALKAKRPKAVEPLALTLDLEGLLPPLGGGAEPLAVPLGINDLDREPTMIEFGAKGPNWIVVGPPVSGKTTTLYSALQGLNKRDVSIITIEDPIEYTIPGMTQIQVNPQTNLTFAQGLRSIVRQDPNVIMVGEIRDEETAAIAVNAAMTGHLLLSTLHTNDAAVTPPRLLDMGIEPFLIASTVNVAVGQRLVRKLCPKCASRRKLTSVEQESLKHLLPSGFVTQFKEFAEPVGCDACNHAGYQGRIGIYEVLEMTERMRHMVMKQETADELRKAAIEEGMTTMLMDGLRNSTSLSEAHETEKRIESSFNSVSQKLDYLESVFPVLVNAGAAVESAKLVSAEQAAVLEQELEEYKISIGRGSQVEPEKLDSLATRAGAVFNPPAQQPYSSQPLLLAGGALLLIVAFFAAKLLAKRRKKAK